MKHVNKMQQRYVGIALLCIAIALIFAIVAFRHPPKSELTKTAAPVSVDDPTDLRHGVLPALRRNEKPRTTAYESVAVPAEGAPWEEVLMQLKRPAIDGNPQAATRLLRDTLRCKNFQSLQERIQTITRIRIQGDQSEAVLKQFEGQLATLQNELTSSSSVCKGASREQMQAELFPVILAAAEAGNETARSCFVDGSSLTLTDVDAETSAKLHTQYATHVAQFVQEGLQNGDWRIVFSMVDAYGSDRNSNVEQAWLADIVKPSAAATYGLIALERNAAEPQVAEKIDESLKQLVGHAHLSEAQIKDAEQWAKETYQGFFSDSPFPTNQTTSICSVSDIK